MIIKYVFISGFDPCFYDSYAIKVNFELSLLKFKTLNSQNSSDLLINWKEKGK